MPATNLITSKLVFRRAQSHSLNECRRNPSAGSRCEMPATIRRMRRYLRWGKHNETIFLTTGSGLGRLHVGLLSPAFLQPQSAFHGIQVRSRKRSRQSSSPVRRSMPLLPMVRPSLNSVCFVQRDCIYDGSLGTPTGIPFRQLSFRAERGSPPYRPRSTRHRTVLVRAGLFS